MTRPNTLLARSLQILDGLQDSSGGILKATEIPRSHRERLQQAGFLKEILRGWYLVATPAEETVIQTLWTGKFWAFMGRYMNDLGNLCLSAEQSLCLQTGDTTLPAHMVVLAEEGGSRTVRIPLATNGFPEGHTFFIYRDEKNFPNVVGTWNGVPVMPLGLALVRAPVNLYKTRPEVVEIALTLVESPNDIVRALIESGSGRDAGRIVGAYRHLGKLAFAENISLLMKNAGYPVRVANPFDRPPLLSGILVKSPHTAKLETLWTKHRDSVKRTFSVTDIKPQVSTGWADVVAKINDRYEEDAYNSLSIEGYSVTPELIRKVGMGAWNPDSADDKRTMDALAAKGYSLAFKAVVETTGTLYGRDPRVVARTLGADRQAWHTALFSPSVAAGILAPEQLAGYRSHAVYLRGSAHVPPNHAVVPELMDRLFELMERESNPGVQAIMGHFLFGYIHPYMDGNGRTARFLMNSVLVAAGYPWTVVHQQNRNQYLAALETASTGQDLATFAKFIVGEMQSPPQKSPLNADGPHFSR